MSRSVGVVVPAFRPDVEGLIAYVDQLSAALDDPTIRIELDDPDEGVRERLDAADAEVATVSERRGKGAAITAGFEALDTDVLAFVDADGATPARSVAAVIDPVRSDSADLSVGSRRHPESDVGSHQTVGRRLLGDGFAWLARRFLAADLYDFQCGAKALSAAVWETVRGHLYEAGFAWDVELIAVAAAFDYRIEEVPITWQDQPGSTVDPLDAVLEMGRTLLTARHRARQIQDSRLHRAIADRRDDGEALIRRGHS
ncbi:glycosyltransferase [Halococcoides cellulosivorans]|uniref:Dolichol-P-glucose transferase n=1 Tax=Halococcoides cellulosivorans TaxID=1679096 RepID=A0A2R4X2P4_9EURY|nr:glycosyltransferase [Halococcoides cellulosivorans]AWB28044.1 dolichol-P-glucose transferase [Halococcoides cellulosivorans]